MIKHNHLSIMVLGVLIICGRGFSSTIKGAGASFPYPVYAKWGYDYARKYGIQLDYASIGSGKGIQAVKNRSVDFGASDAPLQNDELQRLGMLQFPMIIGGVVAVVNFKGFRNNRFGLTPDILADIFLGKITKWNDPRIKTVNPECSLPDLKITVITRKDSSGTTWIFTDYLSKVSPAWKKDVGKGKKVKWPGGLEVLKNEGVVKYVQRINGAIGYVQYSYAVKNKMAYTQLMNRQGRWVFPTTESFQAAVSNAKWDQAKGFHLALTDQPGEKTWPITGASFIIMHKQQKNARHAGTVLDFFRWCYREGQDTAVRLNYIPIPGKVVKLIEDVWASQINCPENVNQKIKELQINPYQDKL